jgi:ribosome biogenesis GTPase A
MAKLIQWYPGHIAKAEKHLQEQLKLVDVIIEVRDARILQSSHHPRVKQWVANKGHILVCNRVDMIPPTVRSRWQQWFLSQQQLAYFANAQSGTGVREILKAAQVAGQQINIRRQQRGMLPRPVRAAVIGFPNVGKSALINRLLNRRVVASANRPGVTRQLRWVRISEEIELLDTPGIIPPLLEDQEAAVKLAICDDIGDAAYDTVLVAAEAIAHLTKLVANLGERYHLNPQDSQGGLAYLHDLAGTDAYQGNLERVARQVLHDYRQGRLGAIALEPEPPTNAEG